MNQKQKYKFLSSQVVLYCYNKIYTLSFILITVILLIPTVRAYIVQAPSTSLIVQETLCRWHSQLTVSYYMCYE